MRNNHLYLSDLSGNLKFTAKGKAELTAKFASVGVSLSTIKTLDQLNKAQIFWINTTLRSRNIQQEFTEAMHQWDISKMEELINNWQTDVSKLETTD